MFQRIPHVIMPPQVSVFASEKNLEAWRADMLNFQGRATKQQGNLGKANQYFIQALKIREEIGDTTRIIQSLLNVGLANGSANNKEGCFGIP